MKPVAILGSGPAGLMAAHAFLLEGKTIAIFTAPDKTGEPKKSKLGGAQFLHAPLPHINKTEEAVPIRYRVRGDALTYRHKVYGGDPNIPFVSMEGLEDGKMQPAWNLQETYDRLWAVLSDSLTVEVIDRDWMTKVVEEEKFSSILSTIPAKTLCQTLEPLFPGEKSHAFISQKIRIWDECIFDGEIQDNTVYYNGDLKYSWYRCSKLFGIGSTEWSSLGPKPMLPGLIEVEKPLRTNCICWPTVHRLGRNGTWTKGVLTHHAFEKAQEIARAL